MTFDWNVTLRRVNYWYDRLVAITKLPTREAKKKAYAKFGADLRADGARVNRPIHLMLAFFSLERRSRMIGDIIPVLMAAVAAGVVSQPGCE